jgi:peptidyl-prolyl cis-trans isomerase A (cyclophilin A)
MISTRTFCGLILGLGACLALGTTASAEAAADKPQVVLDTTLGKITVELDPEKAPITVENFLKYVDDGFYDNLVFHRVISGFMIQGGGFSDKLDEKSKGRRDPIKLEAGNGISNARGTIAMARTSNPNSATSQFFINHADNQKLDNAGGGYAAFGKVIEGMEVVDAIAKAETTTKRSGDGRGALQDVPVKPIYIKSATRVKK